MDPWTQAATLFIAAITSLLKASGRSITAAELGRNADKYVSANVKNLSDDEQTEEDRYSAP